MNNSELDHLLKSVPVPERPADYWEDFPPSVTRRIRASQSSALRRPGQRSSPRLLWGLGFATACIAVAFIIGFWRGRESGLSASQTAAMQKYLREVEALFPNQVRAIVIDDKGPRLVLSEKADVPVSTPLWLNIRGKTVSQNVLTFSGQQIPVNGEVCEVLTDSEGHVLLLGERLVWSSAQPGAGQRGYRIQAQPLEKVL
jgi:hypothetical protein